MPDIITNRFITHEGLRDYDTLLKSWLPDISLHVYSQGSENDAYWKNTRTINAGVAYAYPNVFRGQEEGSDEYVPFSWRLKNSTGGIRLWRINEETHFNKNTEASAATNWIDWADQIISFKRWSHESFDSTGNKIIEKVASCDYALVTVPHAKNGSFRYCIAKHKISGKNAIIDTNNTVIHTFLDTKNINDPELTGQTGISASTNFMGKFPVSRINYMKVPKNDTDNNTTYGLWGSRYDEGGQTANGGYQAYTPRQLCDVSFNPKDQTLTVPIIKAGLPTYAGSYKDSTASTGLQNLKAYNTSVNQGAVYIGRLGADGAGPVPASEIDAVHNSLTKLTGLPNWTNIIFFRPNATTEKMAFAVDSQGRIYAGYYHSSAGFVWRSPHYLSGDDTINGQQITTIFSSTSGKTHYVKKALNADEAIQAQKIKIGSSYYSLSVNGNTLIIS